MNNFHLGLEISRLPLPIGKFIDYMAHDDTHKFYDFQSMQDISVTHNHCEYDVILVKVPECYVDVYLPVLVNRMPLM